MTRPRIVTVAGTRPEAIKLAPVVAALRSDPELDSRLVVTGQHREILDQVLAVFGLDTEADLDVLRPGQRLGALTARAIGRLERVLVRLDPDVLIVQGDTATTFASALAAFYAGVKVVHVEAGLRTGDMMHPFPEEANRRLVSVVTSLHLAPSVWAKANLTAERVSPSSILVTGNTIVDALRTFLAQPFVPVTPGLAEAVARAQRGSLVVVTSHRRENWGRPQEAIARAVARLARAHPAATFLVPLHPNPLVRTTLGGPLEGLPNVFCTEPLSYGEMVHTLARARLALTDSGGIQEEGTALGTPTLVMRQVTERPEGVAAGVVRLVGTEEQAIVSQVSSLLADDDEHARMAQASSVFGDGRAAERTMHAVRHLVGLDPAPPEEFSAPMLDALGTSDAYEPTMEEVSTL